MLRILHCLDNRFTVGGKVVTLMMDAIRSSETSVLIRATRRNIPEDGTAVETSNLS
jgi:hypothetical protein